jgi:hypothetical protein
MTNFTSSSHSLSEISAADIELIENFVLGKKKTIAAAHLQVEYSNKAMKLLDRRGSLVAVSKQVSEWQQKVLLNNQAEGYMNVLCAALERHDFLAARKSRHPDFVEYSKYQVPEGYNLQYQPAHVMGRVWLEHCARTSEVQSHRLLVFQGGNWFPIQGLKIDQSTIQLRTLAGETVVGSNDYLVWIEQFKTPNSSPVNPSLLAATPKATASRLRYSPPETIIDLKSAEKNIHTPKNAVDDITKEIAALQTATQSLPTSDMTTNSVTQSNKATPETDKIDPARKELMDALKTKALKRLLEYVKHGDKVIITEVLKNGQDQTITTKTTEIKRSCPRWVIERIQGAAEF